MAAREPLPEFEKLFNFRDVATIVNNSQGKTRLKAGQLFRSAKPDDLTLQDRNILLHHYHIKTIVDLRTTTELINASENHANREALSGSTTLLPPEEVPVDSFKIPGIHHAEINLNGQGYIRALLWRLSYYNLARVIGYMVWGYRMEAITIIGREVLQPRGLIGLAIDTIEYSQAEIRTFFEFLSQDKVWPTMIHCTQGKDRTGLTIILVLFLCGVDLEAVTQDYTASKPESDAVLSERLKDTSSIGLDESFTRCPQDFPLRVKEHIDEKYGSVERYLLSIGLSEGQLKKIRTSLLEEYNKQEADQVM